MSKNKTMEESLNDLQETSKDFWFEFTKAIGILWFINKINFVEQKDWVKKRLNK